MESALHPTGSPRRWSKRVSRQRSKCRSRKCYHHITLSHFQTLRKCPTSGYTQQVIRLLRYLTGPWNQPSTPPVHPEDGARGCLGNAVSVGAASAIITSLFITLSILAQVSNMRLHPTSDQTAAIPHWLWNQPSTPPVHPEDGARGCLGNAVGVGAANAITKSLYVTL